MENGYIKISRLLVESNIFASEKMLKIWLWCLFKASYKERHVPINTGKGQTVVTLQRGQFIFGRFKAEEELCIDGSTIYKIMKKLELNESISILSNNQYSIVTICKYDSYQTNDNVKVTTKGQPKNSQVTTKEHIQESKESKESKEILLTDVVNFFDSHNCTEKAAITFFEYYSDADWHDQNGKKVKNWKQKALNVWIKKPENQKQTFFDYEKFYQNEISIASKDEKNKELVKRYENFFLFLNGNNETKSPLKNLLSLQDQLTFDSFVEFLKNTKKENLKRIINLANANPFIKPSDSVYNLLLLEKNKKQPYESNYL